MPKVSIIIPTYNSERFLGRAIQSVIGQTLKDWELIIIDDLSKDGTRTIIESWQKKDPRISSIFLEKNSGGAARPLNTGFSKARGTYIAYLDHDDEWLPEKLEKQVSVLEADPKIGLLSCEALTINANGDVTGRVTLEKIPSEGLFPALLSTDFVASNSSLLTPRKVIERLGGRSESPKIATLENREFELRVAAAGYSFFIIHEPLFKYRVHENNSSRVGATQGLNYAEASVDYLPFYKKYNREYLLYERFAREYLKLGDSVNAKKFCKLTFLQKKDPLLMFLYSFLFFGRFGTFAAKKILEIRTRMLYS